MPMHLNFSCIENASAAVELTKRQLLAQTKNSAVARTTVYQWNKLNTAVRMLVHKTKVRFYAKLHIVNYFCFLKSI